MTIDARHKLNVMEKKIMCEVARVDNLRIEELRCRVGVGGKVSNRMDWMVLKWFGHVNHMSRGV